MSQLYQYLCHLIGIYINKNVTKMSKLKNKTMMRATRVFLGHPVGTIVEPLEKLFSYPFLTFFPIHQIRPIRFIIPENNNINIFFWLNSQHCHVYFILLLYSFKDKTHLCIIEFGIILI